MNSRFARTSLCCVMYLCVASFKEVTSRYDGRSVNSASVRKDFIVKILPPYLKRTTHGFLSSLRSMSVRSKYDVPQNGHTEADTSFADPQFTQLVMLILFPSPLHRTLLSSWHEEVNAG